LFRQNLGLNERTIRFRTPLVVSIGANRMGPLPIFGSLFFPFFLSFVAFGSQAREQNADGAIAHILQDRMMMEIPRETKVTDNDSGTAVFTLGRYGAGRCRRDCLLRSR